MRAINKAQKKPQKAITKAQMGAPECIKKGTTGEAKMTVGMLKFELVPNSENFTCRPTLVTNFS